MLAISVVERKRRRGGGGEKKKIFPLMAKKDFSPDAGVVFAFGNTSEKINYSFIQIRASVLQNLSYLLQQLRSVDIDAKSQYSQVRDDPYREAGRKQYYSGTHLP